MPQVEEKEKLELEKILELQKEIKKWKRLPIITSYSGGEFLQRIVYEGQLTTQKEQDLTISFGSLLITNKDKKFFSPIEILVKNKNGYFKLYTSHCYKVIDRFKELNNRLNKYLEDNSHEFEFYSF